jgi:superfamily II DNA/RNA helicase
MNTKITEYLSRLHITALNEMQQASVNTLQISNELILLSPTGSGKTLAYLLPIIDKLQQVNSSNYIQCLVLVPTRELAIQIESVFKKLQTGFKVSCCYGGHSIKTEKNNLIEAPHVLIGTPGRVDDLLKRKILNFDRVSSVVLDEFDKSLEMGYLEEMAYILDKTKRLDTRILTSATNLSDIPEFVGLQNPTTLNYLDQIKTHKKLQVFKVLFGINNLQIVGAKNVDDQNSDTYKEANKFTVIHKLLGKHNGSSILIFFNHRDAVKRLSTYLKSIGVVHELFHGELKQDERERTLAKFRNGTCKILLSTDLAARGLDIPEIDVVVHYHLPISEQAYTHRNGRTARMNADGLAYVLIPENNTELPEFIPNDLKTIELQEFNQSLIRPNWEMLYISKGKKDKINKIDVVGFLTQKGKLSTNEIGLIEVKDFHIYVAIKADKIKFLLKNIENQKIKNVKAKIEIAR